MAYFNSVLPYGTDFGTVIHEKKGKVFYYQNEIRKISNITWDRVDSY